MITGYRFLHDLGHGGFSTVYLAEQEVFDRRVAVKVMRADLRDPDARRRFIRECRATGRLTGNPNIITVFDAGTTTDHRPYIAMEYLPAGTLRQRVAEAGPLPVREMVTVAIPVTRALDAAHEHGILHRDLKPANILLRGPNDPVLSDFGIASVAEGLDPVTVSTAFTVGFAAPEVLIGDQPGPASDVFGLGATLFALLTNRTPYPGRTPTEMFARIQTGGPQPLGRPDVPPPLELLLQRMLARAYEHRPGLDEVAAELGDILAGLAPADAATLAGMVTSPGGGAGTADRADPRSLDPVPRGPQPRSSQPRGPRPEGWSGGDRRGGTRPGARWRTLAVAGPAALLMVLAVALFLLLGNGDSADDAAVLEPGGGSSEGSGTAGPASTTGPAPTAGDPAGTAPTPDNATGTPATSATATAECGQQPQAVRDFRGRTFTSQYMCPIRAGSPVYANVAADAAVPLDDSGYMRQAGSVWVICQLEGRTNPGLRGSRDTWWLYTQGDTSRPNAHGYTEAWGYLPAAVVDLGGTDGSVPGVPPCQSPL